MAINISNQIGKYRSRNWPSSRATNKIKFLVVHYTAIAGNVAGDVNTDLAVLRQIRNGHQANGWPGLSYHFVIPKSGRVYQTNDLTEITFHDGKNVESVGICLDGYFHPQFNQNPTHEQFRSLQAVLDKLRADLGLELSAVIGHREVKGTTSCPGDILFPFVQNYNRTGFLTDWLKAEASQNNNPVNNNPQPKPTSNPNLIKFMNPEQIAQIINQTGSIANKQPHLDRLKAGKYDEFIVELIKGYDTKSQGYASSIDNLNRSLNDRRLNIEILTTQVNNLGQQLNLARSEIESLRNALNNALNSSNRGGVVKIQSYQGRINNQARVLDGDQNNLQDLNSLTSSQDFEQVAEDFKNTEQDNNQSNSNEFLSNNPTISQNPKLTSPNLIPILGKQSSSVQAKINKSLQDISNKTPADWQKTLENPLVQAGIELGIQYALTNSSTKGFFQSKKVKSFLITLVLALPTFTPLIPEENRGWWLLFLAVVESFYIAGQSYIDAENVKTMGKILG
jgi:N-acetyl-anhydromuramyl-L-alanine amidase AmpD